MGSIPGERGNTIPANVSEHTKRKTDCLDYFDPRAIQGLSFVSDDAVHVVRYVEFNDMGIIYYLFCGQKITYFINGGANDDILEARIKLPRPDCPKCLSR